MYEHFSDAIQKTNKQVTKKKRKTLGTLSLVFSRKVTHKPTVFA